MLFPYTQCAPFEITFFSAVRVRDVVANCGRKGIAVACSIGIDGFLVLSPARIRDFENAVTEPRTPLCSMSLIQSNS